jgi:hypothetical protein
VTPVDLSEQIGACKRRIALVSGLIAKAKASGQTTTEAQQQLKLETELLRMLEEMRASEKETAGGVASA